MERALGAETSLHGSEGELAQYIWSIVDLLRGDFKASDYGRIILPLTVLRRLDAQQRLSTGVFHSRLQDGEARGAETEAALANLLMQAVRELPAETANVLELFELEATVSRLAQAGVLARVVSRFGALDLSPSPVTDDQMGRIFEILVRLFTDAPMKTAGEHSTPSDIAALVTSLLLAPDSEMPAASTSEVRLYDPACGVGEMFSAFQTRLHDFGSSAELRVFGQELNAESYAVSRALLLMRGEDPEGIALGNSFSDDRHAGAIFDYIVSHPPFGMGWKEVSSAVRREAETLNVIQNP